MGDVVRIVECRPLSKLKRWRLAEVVRRAAQVGAQPAELDVKHEASGSTRSREGRGDYAENSRFASALPSRSPRLER